MARRSSERRAVSELVEDEMREWEIRYEGVEGTYDVEEADDIAEAVKQWVDKKIHFDEDKPVLVEARTKGLGPWKPLVFEVKKAITVTLINH